MNSWARWLHDNDTRVEGLATKAGWHAHVHAAPRAGLPAVSRQELLALDPEVREDCDEARHVWHANVPTLQTPQMVHAFSLMEQVMASARRDGDRLRGSVVIDAEPGQGKTTIATTFARRLHRQVLRRAGDRTPAGHVRVPVAYVPLTADVTLKGLNRQILHFYGHPASTRASTTDLTRIVVDCATSCETKLIVIDEVHFVNLRVRNGVDVSNHFKGLANQIPATFVFVGVGLAHARFFDEGRSGEDAVFAQTSRRATRCEVPPFSITTDHGARAWADILTRLEQHLLLADHRPGTFVGHAKLLHERTQGRIASLTTLVERAAYHAITSGSEAIDQALLEQVRIDNAAEQSRHSA